MKLRQYGYQEKKVQVRELTIAELKLSIIAGYVVHGIKEVQLIDISSGDSATFMTIEDVVQNHWSGNCKIELINLPHIYGSDNDNKTVVLFQPAEEDGDKVIL